MWITYFLTDSGDEEEDDDVEEQVVIHKKGKRDSRKADDVGKSKKKKRVVVEVRFTLPNSFKCFMSISSSSYYMSVYFSLKVEQEDGDVRQTLKTAH